MGKNGGRRTGKSPDRGEDDLLARLFRSGRTNALVSWVLVGILLTVLGESVIDFDRQWIVFVTATGAIVLLPPIAYRDWRVMLPWEVLVIALFPILVRGLFAGDVGTFATYFAVAGLALLVTVELHMFTTVRLTHWFAVAFVVMATMAVVAVWTILRWNMDNFLGTNFLTTNEALMIEWMYVTLAGLSAGVLFDSYFRHRGRQLRRAIRRVVGG
ncbi:hypothetical protein [Halalkalirubrum salinum]|uniref:hypothetical protein n=1 Tax=Halalkalirubrum salinum TaxID=2563889 RepID=UPI0010FBB873|nr:hypothetical protein [Halalkalirubrum salinum]